MDLYRHLLNRDAAIIHGHFHGHLGTFDAAVRAAADPGGAPLHMLSGGSTPRESMPDLGQGVVLAAPTTHFVMLALAILYRGAGFDEVWPQFLGLAVIGAVFVGIALGRFGKTIGLMA